MLGSALQWKNKYRSYIRAVKRDVNGAFAYEELINSPSLLCMLPRGAKNVLDLGCGDGRFTSHLAKNCESVTGVDISSEMLKEAKSNFENIKYQQLDLNEVFPFQKESYDLLCAKLLLMYIIDIESFAKECFRVTRKGGYLVVSVTHPLKWYRLFSLGLLDSNPFYRGYFSEVGVQGTISNNKELEVSFYSRTIETYVLAFTNVGYFLDLVCEPTIPHVFTVKYPLYKEKTTRPLRLNMRFIKQ